MDGDDLLTYFLEVTDIMPGLLATVAWLIREVALFVSYIKNNAFPQPLSESDEEKHLTLMAAGDENSRNVLIEHNLRLVVHIVNTL
ncbi:hypothetical protein skT53_35120 [Effusibacillus dendaii]|uniref:Uncharacterized protein n=1 Tax=Effusibacillus dendaii TaxID=2743772 RepID=A0A7I8DER2_9BACL|nr:hypothetical protein skT53_35120 [Effusibacillus dendaii]